MNEEDLGMIFTRAIDARDQAKIIRSSTSIIDLREHRMVLRDCMGELRDSEAHYLSQVRELQNKIVAVRNLRKDLELKEKDLSALYFDLHHEMPKD